MAQKEARQLTDREHCRAKVGVYLGGGEESEKPFTSGMTDSELQKLGKETTLYTAFREAIDNSLDMMIEGDATEVYIFKDKTENPTSIKKVGSKDISKIKTWYQYTVGDNGSGIPIKQMINVNTKEKQTTCDNVVSNLKSGTKFKKDKSLIGTNGMGVSCTNFTSLTFSVYSRLSCSDVTKSTKLVQDLYKKNKLTKSKDKTWYYKVTYELGIKVSEELVNLDKEDSIIANHFRKMKIYPSTITTFIPDVTIHEGIDCDISTNYGYLKVMNPKLKFYVNGKEDKYKPEEYDYPFSVKIKSQLKDEDNPNPYMNFNGSIGLAEDLKNFEHNFSVNYLASQKGFHVDSMKAGFTQAFCDYFDDWDIEKYVTDGINILCIADSPTPSFNGQAKERCTKIEGIKKEQCIEALAKEFTKIIKSDEETFTLHYERIREFYDAKQNIGKLKELQGMLGEMVDGKNKSFSKYMPKKLNDCSSKDRSNNEVLFVEGDSAAGGFVKAKTGYNNVAIMGMKGNITNTVGSDINDILENTKQTEIQDLVYLCGGVDGVHLTLDKLPFARYIIASDADADGEHIASLLLAHTLQHSSFMFGTPENDYNDSVIYRVDAPLYIFTKINGTNEHKYFYAGEEKQMNEWKKNNRYKEEKRFKGIGEVSKTEIQEMYLNPETRRLIQIKPQDIEATLELMSPYDEGVAARKELMVEKGIWHNGVYDLTTIIEDMGGVVDMKPKKKIKKVAKKKKTTRSRK